jgi:hypothetical protein
MEEPTEGSDERNGVFVAAFRGNDDPRRIVTLGSYYPVNQILDASGALRFIKEGGETGYNAASVGAMRDAVRWTRWINDLNRGRKWVLQRLFERLDPMLAPDIALAVVPSHDPFQDVPPIRELARRLAASGERGDATGCLVRHTRIKRIVWGGPSYPGLHRDTISIVDPHLVEGRRVLLLDDIAKSGASLRACQELLLRHAGAARVQPMALGRVVARGREG